MKRYGFIIYILVAVALVGVGLLIMSVSALSNDVTGDVSGRAKAIGVILFLLALVSLAKSVMSFLHRKKV